MTEKGLEISFLLRIEGGVGYQKSVDERADENR